MSRLLNKIIFYKPKIGLKRETFLKSIKATLKGYREFKVINSYRPRIFSTYSKAEAAYLRSIYRRDHVSELWGRKYFRSNWECIANKEVNS